MNKPKKLSLTRSTLVAVKTEQSKTAQDNQVIIKTTSICPFICQ